MKLEKILIKKSIFFFIICALFPTFEYSYAEKTILSNSINNILTDLPNNKDAEKDEELQKDIYILGPGDELIIEILGIDIERQVHKILNDGSLNLFLAGNFNATGKTIPQLSKEIVEKLKDNILQPEVSISLAKPRPISVYILGEVNNPGLYTLPYNLTGSNDMAVGGIPTLVSAVKFAGGITQDANLKEVELVRLLPGNKGAQKKTELNLVDLIFKGKKQNNPYLFDGDIIKFKKAESDPSERIKNISGNNLTPNIVNVSIIGEVKNPGMIPVPKNTSLFQSLLLSGGPINGRYSRANVDLFRINRNGTATHKKYKIDFKRGVSPKNPILKDGDVVRVRRNLLAKTSDTLGTVTQPLQGVVTLWSLYKIID